jgi:hypothetical protein
VIQQPLGRWSDHHNDAQGTLRIPEPLYTAESQKPSVDLSWWTSLTFFLLSTQQEEDKSQLFTVPWEGRVVQCDQSSNFHEVTHGTSI